MRAARTPPSLAAPPGSLAPAQTRRADCRTPLLSSQTRRSLTTSGGEDAPPPAFPPFFVAQDTPAFIRANDTRATRHPNAATHRSATTAGTGRVSVSQPPL